MPKSLTPQQGLLYAMITMSAVDRNISDAELQRIGSAVRELPVFKSYDEDELVEDSQACGAVLAKADGLEIALQLIRDALPRQLYETAYALTADVAASDLSVKPEEVRFLELLADKLQLDRLTCAALERAARARHQTAA